MDKFILEEIAPNFKPLLSLDEDYVLGYRNGKIYTLNIKTHKTRKIVRIAKKIDIILFSNFRILERMMRLEPRIAHKTTNDEVIISYLGAIYRIVISQKKIILEHKFIEKMNNPLYMCEISNLKGFENGLYYGEYTGNEQKNPVSIYMRNNSTKTWSIVYTFKKGTINHIHNIIPDNKNDIVYILTGDDSSSSGIWFTNNNFKTVEPVLIGNQLYRTCNLFFVKNGFLYATDTPLESNYIIYAYYLDGDWIISKISELEGTVIYSLSNGDNYYFSTTVEPDSTICGIKYLLTNKLGLGIKSNKVNIVSGNLINGFNSIVEFEKDNLPTGLFQFGAVNIINYKKDNLFIHPVAVKKADHKFYILRKEENLRWKI